MKCKNLSLKIRTKGEILFIQPFFKGGSPFLADDYIVIVLWCEVNLKFSILFICEKMAGFKTNDKLTVGPEEKRFFQQFHQFIKGVVK